MDSKTIAKGLIDTALNGGYHGAALEAAKRLPILTDEERWVICRMLDGTQCANDWRELQMIGNKILADA